MRNSYRPLMLILLLGFCLRLGIGLQYHVVSPDGVYYAQIGEHIFTKGSYGILNVPDYPAIIQPPVYPTLIAISRFVLPRTFAGRAVNILLGTLLIGSIFFITLQLFSKKAAYFAALIMAVHPFFIRYSVKFLSEISFLFFASLVLWAALQYFKKPQFKFVIWAGVSSALAYLTRIEGLALFAIVFVYFAILSFKKRKFLRHTLTLFIIFASVFGAYAQWASSKINARVWIPKLKFTHTHQYIYKSKLLTNPTFSTLPEETRQKMVYYSLSLDNTEIWSYQLFKQQKIENIKIDSLEPKLNKKQLLKQLLKTNISNVAWLLFYRWVIPIGLLPFLGIGLLTNWRNKGWQKHFWLLGAFIPFSYFLISHVEPRFLIGWSFLFIVWIAKGAETSAELLKRDRLVKYRNYLVNAVLLLVIGPSLFMAVNKMKQEDQIFNVTQKLAKQIPANSKTITSRAMHAFFNNWILFKLPWTESAQQFHQYLAYNNIDYLILEAPRDIKDNAFYQALFHRRQDPTWEDWLMFKGSIQEGQSTTNWYKVQKK